MTIKLKNGVFVEVEINDQPASFAKNFLKEFVAHSGFGFSTPGATLKLLDMDGTFSRGDQNLVDGVKVNVKMSRNPDLNEPIEFDMRVMGKVKTEPAGASGMLKTATLVPNLPEYLIEAQREFYDGTSTSAIESILGNYDIEVDVGEGVQTTDSMTWRNIGKTHARFILDILAHAYNGESTCVHGSLDWGTYYIRDLFKVLEREPEIVLFNAEPVTQKGQNVRIIEATPDSVNGLLNALTNYGHTHVQHSISGQDFVFDEANPQIFGKGLPLNSDVKNSIELTSLTNGSWFDSGTDLAASNMHEFYYEAEYLNKRHLSLFSESVRVMADTFHNIPLYECIQLDYGQAAGDGLALNEAFSGKYLIGNKTFIIRDSHYAEVYELARSFIEQPGTTPLVASSNDSTVTPKQTPAAQTAVNPADPQRRQQAAETPNPNIQSTVERPESEEKALARELGELDPDQDPLRAVDGVENPEDKLENKNALDRFVDDMNQQVDDLLQKWEDEGQEFADSAIVQKYGEGRDYLLAVGKEFQSALKKLDDLCSELIDSEKAAINIVGPDIGSMIGKVAQRVSEADNLQRQLTNDLNNLAAQGAIPASFLDNPRLRTNCNRIQDLIGTVNQEINEAQANGDLPTKCLDRFALDRIFGPQNDLARRLRQLESLVDDLLCANGGSQDGSGVEVGGNRVIGGAGQQAANT